MTCSALNRALVALVLTRVGTVVAHSWFPSRWRELYCAAPRALPRPHGAASRPASPSGRSLPPEPPGSSVLRLLSPAPPPAAPGQGRPAGVRAACGWGECSVLWSPHGGRAVRGLRRQAAPTQEVFGQPVRLSPSTRHALVPEPERGRVVPVIGPGSLLRL